MAGVVIVGAGHGGFQCVDSLRKGGYKGEIYLIDREAEFPYQKPPLSKEFLLENNSKDTLLFRAPSYFEEQDITLLLGRSVERIDKTAKTVKLDNGVCLEYSKLVLATGAKLRRLAIEGVLESQVNYIKTLADIERIRIKLEKAESVVVIGGGFIALEFAAVARKFGKQVDVLVRGDRLMKSATTSDLSAFFHQKHRAEGVNIHYGSTPESMTVENANLILKTSDGQTYCADLVVAGLGVEANDELATKCGLGTNDGILVNSFNQTDAPDIYAIGDVARFVHPLLSRSVRLESVQNAVDQAKHVAAHILGQEEAYQAVPWFWTNQFDIKLQMAGVLQEPHRSVMRGNIEDGKFSVFYYDDEGLLQAVHSINKPADHIAARKLLAAQVSPLPEQVADESVKLNSLIVKG